VQAYTVVRSTTDMQSSN